MRRENRTPSQPPWKDGWYRFARHHASPNFGKRPPNMPIDLIVLHSISLPPGQFGTQMVQAFFSNALDPSAHPYFASIAQQQVSSHFFIERNGNLWQFVSCDDRAWHAGVSQHVHAKGRVRHNCNDFSIGIELEGVPGEPFESDQYDTLFSLNAALCQAYPIDDCVGHQHIAGGRKDDPGSGFDWDLLFRAFVPGSGHQKAG